MTGFDADVGDTGHAPIAKRRRQLRTASPGNAQRVGDTSWTREFDVLVWCASCQNRRSEKHTLEHAAEKSGAEVPLKAWQDRCACGSPKQKQGAQCRSCWNAQVL